MSNELKPYSPSLRERFVGALQNALGGSANTRGTASDFADNVNRVADMIPGVSNVLGAGDAYQQYQQGHPTQAAALMNPPQQEQPQNLGTTAPPAYAF